MNSKGISSQMPSRPTMSGSPVSSLTWNGIATKVNIEPKLEIPEAAKSSRKSRMRNGLRSRASFLTRRRLFEDRPSRRLKYLELSQRPAEHGRGALGHVV